MQLEFSRQISEKYWNIEFHEHPSSGNRVVPYGRTNVRTDRHEANSGVSQFWERAWTDTLGFLQNKFLWRVGTRTEKLLEKDEDMIFLLSLVKGIRKKVPECLKIDAHLDILSVIYMNMNLNTAFSLAIQPRSRPRLFFSSDPYYPDPPQVLTQDSNTRWI